MRRAETATVKAAILSALLLCGCAGLRTFMDEAGQARDRERGRAAAERERYLRDAPGLTSGVRFAIERGRVLPGMREDDVAAALGPPAFATASRRGRHRMTEAEYREGPGRVPSVFVTFEDGKAVDVRK
jgi:hypothetical protein